MNGLILAAAVAVSGGDTLELRESSEGHLAELRYLNSEGRNSNGGTFELEFDGVRVEATVIVAVGDEILVVRPLDDGLIAIPDRIDVPDGSDVIVQIVMPMF